MAVHYLPLRIQWLVQHSLMSYVLEPAKDTPILEQNTRGSAIVATRLLSVRSLQLEGTTLLKMDVQ